MQRVFMTALLASAAIAHAQSPSPAAAAASSPPAAPVSAAKKELVAKVIALQQPMYDAIARDIVLRPATQIGQQAGLALQQGVAPEKREAAAKSVDADIRKFIDESVPLLRDRAIKIAPATLGPILEEKMSEDELKQLAAWLDSPVAKKYDQIGGSLQQALGQKLVAEADLLLNPKIQTLMSKLRTTLGVPPPGAPGSGAGPAGSGSGAAPAKAAPPKKAASK